MPVMDQGRRQVGFDNFQVTKENAIGLLAAAAGLSDDNEPLHGRALQCLKDFPNVSAGEIDAVLKEGAIQIVADIAPGHPIPALRQRLGQMSMWLTGCMQDKQYETSNPGEIIANSLAYVALASCFADHEVAEWDNEIWQSSYDAALENLGTYGAPEERFLEALIEASKALLEISSDSGKIVLRLAITMAEDVLCIMRDGK